MRSQGWEVVALDMRKFGWDQASQTKVVIEAIDMLGPFDVLIGSSFGGLATANAAAQRPELPLKLVLLAPAFGYPELVAETLGDEAMESWKSSGHHTFHPPGWLEPVVLPWSFVEAAQRLAWPGLPHPTAILHGSEDDIVPLANSKHAVAVNKEVHLEVVEDGHRLHASLEHLTSLVQRVLSA
jgi:pimeloyl-ACP methyl ester carboxylesterase